MNELEPDLLNYNNEQLEILQRVINSPNWEFIHRLFHNFFYVYKKYGFSKGQINYYSNLHTDLYLEFYMDKRIMYSPTWNFKDYLKWFKQWLSNYDDINLTDEDNKELERITHILRFEIK